MDLRVRLVMAGVVLFICFVAMFLVQRAQDSRIRQAHEHAARGARVDWDPEEARKTLAEAEKHWLAATAAMESGRYDDAFSRQSDARIKEKIGHALTMVKTLRGKR